MKVKVLTNLKHNGREYKPGVTFEGDEETVKSLQASGVLQDPKAVQEAEASVSDDAKAEANKVVELAKKEASELLAGARTEADALLSAAREEAEKIKADAAAEAEAARQAVPAGGEVEGAPQADQTQDKKTQGKK